MTASELSPADRPAAGECWCCGSLDDPYAMVHLGNHPEVALCRPCARWASKQAWEIDDRTRRGGRRFVRARLRRVRQAVIDRGWHRHPVLGRPLRWLGERTP